MFEAVFMSVTFFDTCELNVCCFSKLWLNENLRAEKKRTVKVRLAAHLMIKKRQFSNKLTSKILEQGNKLLKNANK